MDDQQFLEKATELIAQVEPESTGGLMAYVKTTMDQLGGMATTASGNLIVGKMVAYGWAKLFEQFKRYQEAGEIDEDFQNTPHGAALLQEALRALYEGLDEQRAKAVQDVFLGMAKNPPETTLEKIKQLEVVRISGTLTSWELIVLNAIDRYSIELFNAQWSKKCENMETKERRELVKSMTADKPRLGNWIDSLAESDQGTLLRLRDASNSLFERHLLLQNIHSGNIDRFLENCFLRRDGAFTKFGWNLVVHLFSATDATGERNESTDD